MTATTTAEPLESPSTAASSPYNDDGDYHGEPLNGGKQLRKGDGDYHADFNYHTISGYQYGVTYWCAPFKLSAPSRYLLRPFATEAFTIVAANHSCHVFFTIAGSNSHRDANSR